MSRKGHPIVAVLLIVALFGAVGGLQAAAWTAAVALAIEWLRASKRKDS